MRCQARFFGDDRHVHLSNAVPGGAHTIDGNPEHLERVAPCIRWIAIREKLTDVSDTRRAEDGIGDGVRNRITIGMPNEVTIERDLDAPELEGTADSITM
jgi:hypothetical protein